MSRIDKKPFSPHEHIARAIPEKEASLGSVPKGFEGLARLIAAAKNTRRYSTDAPAHAQRINQVVKDSFQ